MRTTFAKKKDLKNIWYIVNAENLVVGRHDPSGFEDFFDGAK